MNKTEIRKTFRQEHGISSEKKIILWQGSTTHEDSLMLIKDTINNLLINKNIVVVLWSKLEWLRSFGFNNCDNLILKDTIPIEEAYKIPAVSNISLAPLPDNRFNRAKSELRLIESAAWHIPCVASAVAPYLRFASLSNGGTVIVKKERTKDWLNSIHSLLDNPSYLEECGNKSYQCVVDHYQLQSVNKKREEWWKSVLQQKKGTLSHFAP